MPLECKIYVAVAAIFGTASFRDSLVAAGRGPEWLLLVHRALHLLKIQLPGLAVFTLPCTLHL